MPASVWSRRFGELPDGRRIHAYTLASDVIEVETIDYGGIITSLRAPDRHGRLDEVVLGHASLGPYLTNPAYLGAVIGRYANRIAGGRFSLDGITYQLAQNDRSNHLHGGVRGFDHHVWAAECAQAPVPAVRLSRTSEDGEEGYPGALQVQVTYAMPAPDRLQIEYVATTDRPTIVNLTQHSYFNLGGRTDGPIQEHELQLHADAFTPVDARLIPTGEVAPVDGTPFDFRQAARIGARLAVAHDQLRCAGGFDHNWVIRGPAPQLRAAARLFHPSSGRVLRIETTEPGLQFYDGHLLTRSPMPAAGFPPYGGLCLETQHFPDSPNHPSFPGTTLRFGDIFRSVTSWQFAVE